jgi:hypothetical protein
LAESGINLAPAQREVVAEAVQTNLIVLGDAPRFAAVFVDEVDPGRCPFAQTLLEPGADLLLRLARRAFEGLAGEYVPALEAREVLRSLVETAKKHGIKGKSLYQPLRVALSGRDEGPELYYLVGGLGKSRIMTRLGAAEAFVTANTPGSAAQGQE